MEFNFNSFFLGAIVTIVLSIVANLLTPDRRSLTGRYRNWLAKRSAKRAGKRIEELKLELDTVTEFVSSPAEMVTYFAEEAMNVLSDFLMGSAATAVALLFPSIPIIPLLLDLKVVYIMPVAFFYWRALHLYMLMDPPEQQGQPA